MARKLRVQFSGAIYHVTVRGNAREKIFLDDRDRERFLERLAESTGTYNVRVYLFCLMPNHVHMVLETPEGNLSRFMQSVETGYTVYFNLRHDRSGHLLQGRYGAKLVEGDEYILVLSRYVHLNPVFTSNTKKLSLKERIQYLRKYPWSSYPSYIGKRKPLEFIDYGPVLAEMSGRKSQRRGRYQQFVESGIAETDEDFLEALKESRHSIGSDEFRRWVNELYIELIEKQGSVEDVSFRQRINRLPREKILEVVGSELGMKPEVICRRRRGFVDRPIAAQMLCKYGGLTQREVADILNVRTGTGVSLQIRKYKELLKGRRFSKAVRRIETKLGKERATLGRE